MSLRAPLRLTALALVVAAFVACGNEKPNAVPAAPPPPPQRGAAAATPDAGLAATVPKIEYTENDFTENDRNRDPFRSFAALFSPTAGKKQTQNQRKVLLSEYSVDELKLVAVVTGGDYPRAMVVDPLGKGWVLKRGDYVGRAETVHVGGASGGADYQLNWRVDRVRDGDLVLLREDPAQPAVPAATRVITLHPDADKDKLQLQN